MARKDIDKRIEQATESTTKLINAMAQLRSEGAQSAEELKKIAENAGKLIQTYSNLSSSVKKSFDQLKDKDVFEKDVKNIESSTAKIKKVQREAQKKYTEVTKTEAQKRETIVRELEERSIRKFKENVKRKAKAEENTRNKIAASNKKNTQRVTEFEKRQLDRRAAYYAKKEKEKTAALKKEEKERKDTQKKNDFRGGFGAQFTPRAIGGALGSLTKYLGLYQLINGAVQLFTELTLGSAKAAIEFEKSLANLSAVAGVTGSKVDQLGDNALKVAAKTKFTAIEIVGMQTELAKLGFTSDQIIASTQAVAFSAQALGSSLAETAATFGKLINQFSLLAEQSEYVGDVIVTTINKSALSFDGFNTAIQYIGPIADQLGLSLEQTAGAMAVLSDSGFTASRVGTGLRGILTEIGKTSVDAERELKKLAEAHIGLSEAVDLVGKRNAAQLLVLLKNIDAIDENNDKYYEAGRALEAAAIQTDTFDGKLKILQSTLKNMQISIGNVVTESGLFNTALSVLSDQAGRTVEGLKAVKNISESNLGFDSFLDSADRVATGFDSLQESIELLRASGQITEEQFNKLNKMSYSEFDKFINDSRESYLMWGGKTRKENMLLANSVQGLREQLEAQANVSIRQNAINDGITRGNNAYKTSVDELTKSYEDGNNVIEDADILYEQIDARLTEVTAKLKENSEASALNKTMTERTRLGYEGESKALQDLLDTLANLSAANKQRIKDNVEVYKSKKLDMSSYEKQLENLDEEYRRLKKLNELRGDEVQSGNALLIINKSKVDLYDEMIGRLDATASGIYSQIAATDSSTDAGKKKIAMHLKELEAIDKLKKKYGEQKESLTENLGVMEEIFAQGSKDLKAAADQEATVDIKIADQNRIIKQLEAQLLEAAGDDEQLQEIARAYISSLYVKMEDEASSEDAKKSAEKIAEQQRKLFADIAKYAADAANEYNKTALENKKNALKAELDAVKNKFKVEQDILKSNLDNQLITESQYRAKSEELRKKELQQENDINKKIFEAEKKADSSNVIIETLEALASNAIQNYKNTDAASATALTAAGYVAIAAAGAAKLDAIRRRKFYEVKYEEGGLVQGPSHAQGGVPFTVQGQPGYEMEGGEFIVNKKASSLHRDLLERINNSTKKFAQGGLVTPTVSSTGGAAQESVNYLRAIAEATTTSAIQGSKPVRAFVSARDLRSSENERRLKERNDRI